MAKKQRSESADATRSGFTLVELLVVIAIVALLVSILLPALHKARAQAQKTVCAAQLKSIAMGVMTYSEDNSAHYPIYTLADKPTNASLHHDNQVNLWGNEESAAHLVDNRRKLTDYMERQIGRCPADEGYPPGTNLPDVYLVGTFYEVYGSSHIYNTGALDSINGSTTTSLGEIWGGDPITEVLYNTQTDEIRQPSHLVMAGDRTIFHAYYFTFYPGSGTFDWFLDMKIHDPESYLTNLVFTDGHVQSLVLHESPEHFRNSEYRLVRKDYPHPPGDTFNF